MPSQINPAVPAQTSPTTASVRLNFQHMKNEIEALQGGGFSFSERDTGMKWIDGSTIWQKTVQCPGLLADPSIPPTNTPHGIQNLGVIVSARGFASNGNNTLPIPFSHTTLGQPGSGAILMQIAGANISIFTGVDRSAYTQVFVTLRYTKTS